ncbi:hypothetical protein KDI_43230 [Dictyobacter arantiisoli]|uniref:Tn3 transposase DDE domain-containing protein n=1 Tax=Dictyobacter arantiisoli TaxID=2014874 RepID=A0A5A5TIC6_9CHLR|nr:hypothetical protein KDI_43230 [Dictyobacter arantiisoli]
MLALHLLQIPLVYVNTLMVQKVLEDETWMKRLTKEDYRGLTPLFYAHVEPYGSLRLDMDKRLALVVNEAKSATIFRFCCHLLIPCAGGTQCPSTQEPAHLRDFFCA